MRLSSLISAGPQSLAWEVIYLIGQDLPSTHSADFLIEDINS